MNENPRGIHQHPQMQALIFVGAFSMFQVILMLILWLMSHSSGARPSWAAFVYSISTSNLNQLFLGVAAIAIVAQQVLKSRFLKLDQLKVTHLILLLALGEVPGLLGFVGGLVDHVNVSLALPFIFISLLSFMSLKPIALSLSEQK